MTLYISRGVNVRYFARVRLPGHRKWQLIGGFTKSRDKAFSTLAKHFVSTQWKRGEVLMTADYYDPIVVVEMRRP